MSRRLSVVLLATLILAGAMGLKTLIAGQSDGPSIMAIGGAPPPDPPPPGG